MKIHFFSHGGGGGAALGAHMRYVARDAAQREPELEPRLGERNRVQQREALQREARAHRPTRLDALIERQIEVQGQLRLSRLRAPDRDPEVTKALKTRARELQRLGLADETKRNVLTFSASWRGKLSALEMHLDIRKRLMQERRREPPVRQMNPPGLGRGRGVER